MRAETEQTATPYGLLPTLSPAEVNLLIWTFVDDHVWVNLTMRREDADRAIALRDRFSIAGRKALCNPVLEELEFSEEEVAIIKEALAGIDPGESNLSEAQLEAAVRLEREIRAERL